jgi:putative N6-adenine-specific DNA methylase
MDNLGNMEKRIKRHVLGKRQTFFVSTSPGLAPLCLDELLSIGISKANTALVEGGVEFAGPVHDCYLANLRLRTANRILMRMEGFRVTNFRQLAKRVIGLPWELYLRQGTRYNIRVTSRRSRLFHKEAISEQFKRGIAQRWAPALDTPEEAREISPFAQQLFVRAVNDRFTLSIDSSGELLYRRGLKTHRGKAPVRETIASAILMLTGYNGRQPLLDPMCGTGTFSLEAAMMANHIPAGWYRDFAFMGWPCFKATRWRHIRREAERSITPVQEPMVFASDKDPHACQALKSVVRHNDLSGSVSVLRRDFFDLLPSDFQAFPLTKQPGLVVINPPYGRRLGGKTSSEQLFLELCRKLKKDFPGWKAALIVPHRGLVKRVPFSGNVHSLFHGGLRLTLLTGTIG